MWSVAPVTEPSHLAAAFTRILSYRFVLSAPTAVPTTSPGPTSPVPTSPVPTTGASVTASASAAPGAIPSRAAAAAVVGVVGVGQGRGVEHGAGGRASGRARLGTRIRFALLALLGGLVLGGLRNLGDEALGLGGVDRRGARGRELVLVALEEALDTVCVSGSGAPHL